jgi:hypothetical protein
MAITWDNPPSTAVPEMFEAYRATLNRALWLLALSYAPQIEAWMKQNAAWTDRTSNARQTLWAEAFDFTDVVVLAFGHGVDYGVFLELANAGRYSIIFPALDYFSPKIWADVEKILKR